MGKKNKESERPEYFITRAYPNGDILNTQLDIFTIRPLSDEFFDKLIASIIEDLKNDGNSRLGRKY